MVIFFLKDGGVSEINLRPFTSNTERSADVNVEGELKPSMAHKVKITDENKDHNNS